MKEEEKEGESKRTLGRRGAGKTLHGGAVPIPGPSYWNEGQCRYRYRPGQPT